MKRKAETRIKNDNAGQQLLDFLEQRFTYHERETWRAAVTSERILQNGVATQPDAVLQTGDLITYLIGEEEISNNLSGKYAITHFHKLSQHLDGKYSFLEIIPETGRYHQIRATLLSLGYPLLGDKMYGCNETIFLRFCKGRLTAEDHRELRLNRQALHARELRLDHPETAKAMKITAPIPSDIMPKSSCLFVSSW